MSSPARRRARALEALAHVPDARLGRVDRVDVGVLVVATGAGPVRATYGGGLLALVARDPDQAPRPGDEVVLRDWPEGHVTVERVVPPDPLGPRRVTHLPDVRRRRQG